VKYTVVWAPDAERELATVWVNSTDRNALTGAANFLDRELARDPSSLGESRPSGLRIAHCLPLGIRYQIQEEDRLVRVLAVWQCHRIDR
jgi:hypothetical protein